MRRIYTVVCQINKCTHLNFHVVRVKNNSIHYCFIAAIAINQEFSLFIPPKKIINEGVETILN